MFERILKTVKTTQPVSTTGMFAHTYYWLTYPSGDQFYSNPVFKNEQHQDKGTAIYFIHGTADQSSAFQRVAERLIQAGLPNEISSLNLVSFKQRYQGKNIEFFAEQLREKIKANQHQRIILIAHSRGGLVAAYFAEFLARSAGIEVVLICTIGTPFNGSYLAMKPLSWFSDSVREMEIDSEFLKQLKEKILENATGNYYFFIAKEDAIVPGESGCINEYVDKYPNSLIILDRHGHLSIMSSHRLVFHVTDLLHKYFNPNANPSEATMSIMEKRNIIEDYYPGVTVQAMTPT
jgi:predicted alpha/beta hydrolase family esterase